MSTKVAIVILNWNGKKYLEQFLPSVVKYSDSPEFITVVADNNSNDDSIAYVKGHFPEIKTITFEKNYGYSRGYALALSQIEADYYVLLNSDMEVTKNWLNPLLEMMENDDTIAAIMPKIRSYNQKEYFEYAGAAGGFIDKYGYPFCRGRILTAIEKDEGQYDNKKEIFWASGACMFLRASAYSKTGGFDGDFFAHMEEIDLCWRLKRLSYKIYYCPDSVVFHVGGGTLPNDNPRKLYYNYRNSLFLLTKNLKPWNFLTILLPRIFLDAISAMAYLIQGKFLFFISVFRAHCRFYWSLPRLINKRRIFNRIIAKNRVTMIYPKSIVYQFFVNRIRNFGELNF
jgi:GT2 family glycosyltransferase